MLPAEGDQLPRQVGASLEHFARLDYGLDLLAELLVGHPKDGHVEHPWMGDQQVLAFLAGRFSRRPK
jgi:hypothetical protein